MILFGRNKGKKKSNPEKEKPVESGIVKYIGGHKRYPKEEYSHIHFYKDRFVLGAYNIVVPYSQIKDVGNSNETKRHEDWAALGLLGLLWKKKYIYTIITYYDGIDDQTIVIDFENNLEYAQNLIYTKMLEFRKSDKPSS